MLSTYSELLLYSYENPDKLIVLDFKASWCVPCKNIKPFYEYLKVSYPNVHFLEIDIEDDDTSSITDNFTISKLPTFIYFKNSIICHSFIGTDNAHIETAINDNI